MRATERPLASADALRRNRPRASVDGTGKSAVSRLLWIAGRVLIPVAIAVNSAQAETLEIDPRPTLLLQKVEIADQPGRSDVKRARPKLNLSKVQKVSSEELLSDLLMNDKPTYQGKLVLSQFHYMDNTFTQGARKLEPSGRCGGLAPYPLNLRFSFPDSMETVRKRIKASKKGVFLCFPTAALYDKFGSNCEVSIFTGARCIIYVLGVVSSPTRLDELRKEFGIPLGPPFHENEVEHFYITPLYMKVVDRNAAPGIEIAADWFSKAKSINGGLEGLLQR